MNIPTRVHSTCPHDCPSTCALEVEILDNKTIGRVYGAKDNAYTAGTLCAKVGRYAERVHHPDRLKTPLKRTGDKGIGIQAFRPISWQQALDETAEALLEAEQKYGSETVWPYFFAGTMGLIQRDSIERLRHVKKYARQHSTICTSLPDAGYIAGAGLKRGVNPIEIAQSDLIVIWGGNPVYTQVNVMSHVVRACRERNAKVVVVDPYKTATAKTADQHLMLRPGTDGALACAVMHVLFAEGLADKAYLQKYTDFSPELEAHLKTRSPQWAAEITGLSSNEIIEFAQLYGNTKRSYMRLGYGFARSRNGATNMHAALCLPAVTGAWQYEGGGALYSNSGMYDIDQTIIKGLDAVDQNIRMLDQSRIGAVLNHNPIDLQSGPPVTALFIQNTNPMVVCPDLNAVHKGFARDDLFVCVHEQFMTETAAVADIVLPATTFLEHDDFYQAGGHTYLQVARKVIEPYAESRSNQQVICELAKRLGAEHPGFAMTEWELIEDALKRSDLPDAQTIYDKHWHDMAPTFEEGHYLNGFKTPDQKFHFSPDWSRVGANHKSMPRFPDFVNTIDNTNEQHPYRLVAAPARNFLNSTFVSTPTSLKMEKRPTLQIHPEDAVTSGITNGSKVQIGNGLGAVTLHAKHFDGLQHGTVIVESIWPNNAFENGIGINALISAEAAPPNGGAVFHDTAVWIKPLPNDHST
ncbi:MAG: molybdopterin oxidoreductase family protein [Arenicellales bacterium WSBS_2016_MAG_OTU3]